MNDSAARLDVIAAPAEDHPAHQPAFPDPAQRCALCHARIRDSKADAVQRLADGADRREYLYARMKPRFATLLEHRRLFPADFVLPESND